ncbi:hypothetical protein ACFWPQ_25730 [Streptomyces sp. NPDC058464]|uniref:hypothetical protein n=1 Tax=Streptomyces sp. NPDC058464 TaxID=3346511 RepID=UPI0036540AE6
MTAEEAARVADQPYEDRPYEVRPDKVRPDEDQLDEVRLYEGALPRVRLVLERGEPLAHGGFILDAAGLP